MMSGFTASAIRFAESIQPIADVATVVLLVMIIGMFFVVSPFSNILNVITVPLGYEWSSCPNCPDVTINKIEWAECDNCGRRHRTNFGAARYKDGNKWRFCDSDCLDAFTPGGVRGE